MDVNNKIENSESAENIKTIHAVGILIENTKGEILLLLRQKDKPEPNTYGPPGGRIEEGETKKEASMREISEEIGLEVLPDNLEYLKTYDNEWQSVGKNIKFEVFRSKLLNEDFKPTLAIAEAAGYLWIKPEEAHKRKDLMPGLYVILKDVYNL
jgi:mutator protein MutT